MSANLSINIIEYICNRLLLDHFTWVFWIQDDDHKTTGCLNMLCQGYVLVSQTASPGMVLPTGTAGIRLSKVTTECSQALACHCTGCSCMHSMKVNLTGICAQKKNMIPGWPDWELASVPQSRNGRPWDLLIILNRVEVSPD